MNKEITSEQFLDALRKIEIEMKSEGLIPTLNEAIIRVLEKQVSESQEERETRSSAGDDAIGLSEIENNIKN